VKWVSARNSSASPDTRMNSHDHVSKLGRGRAIGVERGGVLTATSGCSR
jgi:hypothetical protein